MLVISRKNGQKIMINDNIVITVVEARNGQCKIAIEAIYYQIKLANLVGKNTDVSAVDSVANMLKEDKSRLNDTLQATEEAREIELDNKTNSKKIIIKKQNNTNL